MPAPSQAPDTPRPSLSPRQADVLRAIEQNLDAHGCPPTIRELGGMLGLRSTNGVASHLAALQRKGYLDKRAHKSRTWRPVARAEAHSRAVGAAAAADTHLQVPLLGQVAAGLPALAIEQAEETLAVDPKLLPRRCEQVFALRIVGASMCEAGIAPGDIVLVERRDHAEPGAIVVAALGDEATVKRYRPDPAARCVRLEPANHTMQPIVVEEREAASLRIIGVVVGVWRRL